MHVHFIRGLPGSGKSTIAREYTARGYIHIEADDFFVRAGHGVYDFERSLLGHAHRLCRSYLTAALMCGEDVVIANTFSRRWEMDSYLAICAEFGATVTEETATCTYADVHDVPQEIITRMREWWEN